MINIATEDALTESLAVRLVDLAAPRFEIGLRLGKKGASYLRGSLSKFRRLSDRAPLLMITDLDRQPCASHLIRHWCADVSLPEQFILRVAVREAESWVLADRAAIAARMGLSVALFTRNPDEIADPKRYLLEIAKRAKREVRSELVAERGAVALQGLGYNRVLTQFIERDWDPLEASNHSPSLARAISRIRATLGT